MEIQRSRTMERLAAVLNGLPHKPSQGGNHVPPGHEHKLLRGFGTSMGSPEGSKKWSLSRYRHSFLH